MADQRTMAELLQAPTEGYGDAIVIPAILAENFELKHGLLNLVTSKQFYGFEKEDPHAHIRWFNKITSTIKYKDVPNSSIKLMLFPFSIEGAARIWLEKEPPHSILTWEDLVSKFINQFFPPSKTTNLWNEITNFQQRFDESFCEAWDHFKDLLRACPHHGFTELHQLDTFYNALTPTDQDSLNAAAGGNLLTKTPRDALAIIENKSKVRNSRNKPVVTKVSTNAPSSSTPHFPEIAALADAVKAMLLQKSSPSAFVKAVEEICVTCGGPHPYHQCLATDGNVFPEYRDNIQGYVSAAAVNYNQGNTGYRPQSKPATSGNCKYRVRVNIYDEESLSLSNRIAKLWCSHVNSVINTACDQGRIQKNSLMVFAAALAILITGASQSRQHDKSESDSYYLLIESSIHFTGTSLIHIESHHRFFPVDTSLIHIESRKSPTKSLIDVGSRRISIIHSEYKEYHSDVLQLSQG
ncbi:reverse transcriptase domain-containing protein [Tanacetum coccineum]